MSKKQQDKLVRKKPIPVVISPWGELCITDHHHFLFACWHADIHRVKIKVVKDYSNSKLTYSKFWQKMCAENYAYPYDQFGEGPRKALYLPMDVRGMSDDPYRSLAWMVRKEGGYENSTQSFAEFQWADFFRNKGLLDSHGRSGFHLAVHRGLKLSQSNQAKNLPGFINRKRTKQTLKEEALPKSKYVPKSRTKGPMATVPETAH